MSKCVYIILGHSVVAFKTVLKYTINGIQFSIFVFKI